MNRITSNFNPFADTFKLDLLMPTPRNLEPIRIFFATSSLKEKLGRVFNNMMFGIVIFQLSWKIAKCIPKIKVKVKELEENILKNRVVSTLVKYKIHWIPSILVSRKIVAVLIGYLVYPATMVYAKENLNPFRNKSINHFESIGYKIQAITLNKSGINYDAFLLGPKENLMNGNWVQVAGGNGFIGECVIKDIVEQFKGMNILYVNGPGVGRSTGLPTTFAIGAGQEAGLQLLEKMNIKKIFLYGTSLGGGAQAAAICSHVFKKGVEYMVWADRSFSKLSHAAGAMVHPVLKVLFPLLGIELDGVAGAVRLNNLGITQIITNNYQGENINGILPKIGNLYKAGTDGVIPNIASLYTGIRSFTGQIPRPNIMQFFGHRNVPHNGPLDHSLNNLVFGRIAKFFGFATQTMA